MVHNRQTDGLKDGWREKVTYEVGALSKNSEYYIRITNTTTTKINKDAVLIFPGGQICKKWPN